MWVNKVSLELVTTLRPFIGPITQNPPFLEAFFFGRKMVNLEMNVVLVPMKSVVLLMWAQSTRWAPTSYKWSYNPYKWPYNWVTGVITPISGLITILITGRGPTLYILQESKPVPIE